MKTKLRLKLLCYITLTISIISLNGYANTNASYVYDFDNAENVSNGMAQPTIKRYSFTNREDAERLYEYLRATDPYTPVKVVQEAGVYYVVHGPISPSTKAIQENRAREGARAAPRARAPANAHAREEGDNHRNFHLNTKGLLVTLTAGPDFVQNGREQTLSLLPPFQNHYTNTEHLSSVADGGVFVGVERAVSDKWRAQLGLAGYVDAQMSPEGHVWLFACPESDTLGYAYTIHHTRIVAEGKFLTTIPQYQQFNPYVSWGLGAAFNRASNYLESPLIPNAIPTLPFANHMTTSVTWGVGAGVDYSINPNLRLGAGYQFADLGAVSLGSTKAATTAETLNFSHLLTNQLRLQLTFLM